MGYAYGGAGRSLSTPRRKPRRKASGYSEEALFSMKMSELRDIGDKYDVKDNIKSELIDKILKAVK